MGGAFNFDFCSVSFLFFIKWIDELEIRLSISPGPDALVLSWEQVFSRAKEVKATSDLKGKGLQYWWSLVACKDFPGQTTVNDTSKHLINYRYYFIFTLKVLALHQLSQSSVA